MTSHYILIDQHTGFVWGDPTAADPVAACRAVDISAAGEAATDYVEHSPYSDARLVQTGGYLVYEAPADFDLDAYGGGDGQLAELITAVRALPLVAFVEIVAP